MAGSKAVKNATKAAGSKVDNAAKAGDVSPFAMPKGDKAMLETAKRFNISTGQVRDLFGSIIPELQAAGTPNSTIKGFLSQQDPHLAAKQYLASERAELVDQLVGLNVGYTPESLAKTPLRELWTTFEDASKPPAERASNLKGKVDEPPTTESRLPGENTATADTNLGEIPAEQAAAAGGAPKSEAAAGEAAPKQEGGPPNAKDRKRAKWEERQKMAANAEKARGGNWGEVDWKGSNRDSGYAGRTAADGDWSRLTADDFSGTNNAPNPTVEMNRGSAPQAAAPPGGGGPPGGPPNDPPGPKGPSLTDTDPLLYRGKQALGAGGWVFKNAWPTAIGTAAGVYGIGRALGHFGGGSQPAPGQPMQQGQGGQPVQINILSRDRLRELERSPRPMQPQMAPPQMQPPMQPPAQPQARPGQTTDIIRQLAGRMA